MEFNKDILNYCVRGVKVGDPNRYPLAALKVFTKYFGIDDRNDYSNSNSTYFICKDLFDTGYVMLKDISPKPKRKIVSPEEYVSILIGQSFDSHWYENIEVGSTLQMGWADRDSAPYNFGFQSAYVNDYRGSEMHVEEIRDYGLSKFEATWDNGDNRIYRIKEFDHWFPSAVFVPLLNTTPIKKLGLTSISIKGLEL